MLACGNGSGSWPWTPLTSVYPHDLAKHLRLSHSSSHLIIIVSAFYEVSLIQHGMELFGRTSSPMRCDANMINANDQHHHEPSLSLGIAARWYCI